MLARPWLVLLFLGSVSCKQTCGLDQAGDGGGGSSSTASTSASANTSVSVSVSTGTGGSEACTSAPGLACTCSDDFEVPGGEPQGCWIEQNAVGATRELVDDGLMLTPAAGTGFWYDGRESYFLYTRVSGPFLAVTNVKPYRNPVAPASDYGWPVANYNLAGWVARPMGSATAWIKAEAGSINPVAPLVGEPEHGLRVAHRDGLCTSPAANANCLRDTPITMDAQNILIALCRTSLNNIFPYYRVADPAGGASGTWQRVVNGEAAFSGPMDVGLVAAAGATGDDDVDMVARFIWAEVREDSAGALLQDEPDCLSALGAYDVTSGF